MSNRIRAKALMFAHKFPLMSCGHIAQEYRHGKPVCACCNVYTIETEKVDLNRRVAICTNCEQETESDLSLPYFKYQKDSLYDSYYCGCNGWWELD